MLRGAVLPHWVCSLLLMRLWPSFLKGARLSGKNCREEIFSNETCRVKNVKVKKVCNVRTCILNDTNFQ